MENGEWEDWFVSAKPGVRESMTPNCRDGGAGVRLAWLGLDIKDLNLLY